MADQIKPVELQDTDATERTLPRSRSQHAGYRPAPPGSHCQRCGYAHEKDRYTEDQHGLRANPAQFVDEIRCNDLEQRDARCERRHKEQREKHAGEQHAARHLVEHDGERHEHKPGALGRFHTECEQCRKDREAGHDGDQRVHEGDLQARHGQVVLRRQIRAVGDHRAHPYTEGKESVSHRDQHHRRRQSGEVRPQHEVNAGARAGQGHAAHCQCRQQDEQNRHHDLARPFNTALDPPGHDHNGGDHEQAMEHEALGSAAGKGIEVSPRFFRARQLANRSERRAQRIGHDPPRNYAVERQQERPSKHTQSSNPLPRRPRLDRLYGSNGIEVSIATEDKLGEKKRYSNQDNAGDIHQDEGSAAVFSHDVGKTPNVPEANRRTSGGQEKSGLRAPRTACFLVSHHSLQYSADPRCLRPGASRIS